METHSNDQIDLARAASALGAESVEPALHGGYTVVIRGKRQHCTARYLGFRIAAAERVAS